MAYCGPRALALSDFLRWTQKDQDAALEWSAYESRRCRSCGTHPDEWAEDRYAYHAHLSQCKGCQRQQGLSEASETRTERGVSAVMAPGPAHECPQCRPDDD